MRSALADDLFLLIDLNHAVPRLKALAGMLFFSGFTKVTPMHNGTVKWFNSQKGFGFIQPSNGGTDVFVHISAVERAGLQGLNEGQKLIFDIVADRRTGKSSADRLQLAD